MLVLNVGIRGDSERVSIDYVKIGKIGKEGLKVSSCTIPIIKRDINDLVRYEILLETVASQVVSISMNSLDDSDLEESNLDLEEDSQEDVSLTPGPNADGKEDVQKHIRSEVLDLYDVYSYRHGTGILKHSFPKELEEIENALLRFRITTTDIAMPGGNESVIPKKFSAILRPSNWYESRIQGDLVVRVFEGYEELLKNGKIRKHALPPRDPITLQNYIDGHKIDYVKGRVALDVEWNSKDQTYDRDLYAFRMFYECGVISVAVLITRSEKLNEIFAVIPARDKKGNIKLNDRGNPMLCKGKYGASTTWMGKLIFRLNAARNGGCPVVVFGIRPDIVTDWEETRSCNEPLR